ncbi:MAG: hypothetical protein U1F76_18130 [Candidatus Competibacteraceae bacterium]
MNKIICIYTVFAVIATLLSLPLYAGDVFVITSVTADKQTTVTAGGSDFLNVVQQALEATGPFAPLENKASTSVLEYGGAKNAMQFEINRNGTEATLTIPSTGFQETFKAANRNLLYNQINNFFQNQGRSEYKKFLEQMNRQSTVAVSDGNPNSTTALVAKTSFQDAGFGGEDSITKALDMDAINLSLMAGAGQFSSRGIDGRMYSLPLGYSVELTDRVGAKFRMPVSYVKVEDATIYNGSILLNVPVKVFLPGNESAKEEAGGSWLAPLSWSLTPTLGMAGGGSQDYRAGSVMYIMGLASMLNYDFGPFGLTLGNQLTALKGLSIGNYDVGARVDQQILKNGLKVTVPFYDRWVAEVYGIHTAFLQEAAVGNYFTLGVQGGMRLFGDARSESGLVLLGLYSEVGSNYRSFSLRLGSGFRF